MEFDQVFSLLALSLGLNATSYNQGNHCILAANIDMDDVTGTLRYDTDTLNLEAQGNQSLTDCRRRLVSPPSVVADVFWNLVIPMNHPGLGRYRLAGEPE